MQTLIPALFYYVSSPPHPLPLPLHLTFTLLSTSPSPPPPHLHPPLHLTFTLLSTSPSLSSSPPHLTLPSTSAHLTLPSTSAHLTLPSTSAHLTLSPPPHLHPPLHLTFTLPSSSPSHSSPPHLHPPLHFTFTLPSTSPSRSSPPHLHPLPLHLTFTLPFTSPHPLPLHLIFTLPSTSPHLFLSTSPSPSSPPHLHPPLHLTFTLLSTSPSPSSPPHLHSPLHLTFTLPSTSPSRSSPPHLHPLPLYLTFTLFLSTSPSPSSPPHDALRDRLVCGLRNTGIQKRLLSEASLTLAKAGVIAQGMEAAEKNAKRLQGGEAVHVPINKVIPRREKTEGPGWRKQEKPCYRCGRSGHVPSACRFRDATCHKCQKKGHIAKACRSGPSAHRRKLQPKSPKRGARQVQTFDQGTVSDPEVEEFTMFKVGGKTHEPIVVTLGVNGQQLPMEVGTGAAVSVISTTTRENLFHSCQLNSTSTILTTYTGQLSSQRTQETECLW